MRLTHLLLSLLALAATATPIRAAAPRGVRALDDATFEHATQAATGQTTGRWLVLLWPYAGGIVPPELSATLARAARAAPGTHAATVDTIASPATAKRLGTEGPAVFLFADRHMYMYGGNVVVLDDADLASFAADPESTGATPRDVPPASVDIVAAALAALKSGFAAVADAAKGAGVDVDSIKARLSAAGVDADALAARARDALDAAPGGAQGAAAAGLGGLAVVAVALARAGGRRAAAASSSGVARRTRAAAKKRA